MKHIVMIALVGAAIQVGANDVPLNSQRIQTLLHQNATATELDWQHKDLANEDFKGLGIVVSHVKKLNLSDNHFSGDFPLSTCLKAFPNLETLIINNHERMKGFEIEQGYKNDKLKVLDAENNGCKTVNVAAFYNFFELETLDISDSKQLEKLDHKGYELRASGKMLKVHLRNVVAEEDRLNDFRKHGILETSSSNKIKCACGMGGVLLFGAIWAPLPLISPDYAFYALKRPIPVEMFEEQQWPLWTNMCINTGLGVTASCLLGLKIGNMIVSRCLPNGGKVTAIKLYH